MKRDDKIIYNSRTDIEKRSYKNRKKKKARMSEDYSAGSF